MKSATRVLAAIATGGVMAGGAAALVQVSAPKAAATVAVTTSAGSASDASDQEMQQLTAESAQLHAAVVSAQGQLATIRADVADTPQPTASPADLAALLAQAESQLATAQRRLATDEALIAKLQPKTRATFAAPSQNDESRPATVAPSTAPVQQTQTEAAATTPPPPHRTHSASPWPTNGAGDD